MLSNGFVTNYSTFFFNNRTHSDLSTEIYMAKYIYIFQIYWETLSQIYKYMQYVFVRKIILKFIKNL